MCKSASSLRGTCCRACSTGRWTSDGLLLASSRRGSMPMESVPTHFVQSSQAELCVAELGAGEPLIFLHAGVADRRMWAAQQQHLHTHHRTLAYDRRGFGATRAVAEPFNAITDLLNVMDDAGIERAVLIGCSMGGMLAAQAAFLQPSRVRALVLIASATGVEQPAPQHSTIVQTRLAAIAAAEATGDVPAVNALQAQLWLDGPEQARVRVQGPARKLFLDMNGIALAAGDVGVAERGPSLIGKLQALELPVLLLAGEFDFPGINRAMADMAKVLPHSELHTLEGCAHLPSVERPDLINAFLTRFLRGLTDA